MYIESITIYGFGKFIDKQFDFNKGFNVLLGHNEDGKSTIQQFIKSILFGFSNHRKKETNHYVSKVSSQHGGKVVLNQTKYGKVIVERIKKKDTQRLSVHLEDGTELSENSLLDILNYLDEEMFDRFFSLNLSNLTMLSQLKSNELSRYFLTLGKENSDKLFNIVDTLDKNANDIYSEKATKKPLNQQLEQLQQSKNELLYLQKKQDDYVNLITQKDLLLKQIEENRHTLNDINKKIQQLSQLKDVLPLYEQYKQLSQSENSLIIQKISENEFEQYINNNKTLKVLNEQKVKYQERQFNQTETIHSIENEQFEWYLQHKDSNKMIIMSLPKIEKIIQESVKIEHELNIKQTLLLQEKERLNLVAIPHVTDEFIKKSVQYEKDIADLTNKIDKLQYQKENLRQQLDEYFVKSKQKSNRLLQVMMTSGIGVVWIILGILFNYLLVGLGVGATFILYGLVSSFIRHHRNKNEQRVLDYKIKQIKNELMTINNTLKQQNEHIDTIQNQFVVEKERLDIPYHTTLLDITSGRLENVSKLEHNVKQLLSQQEECEKVCQQQLDLFKAYAVFSNIQKEEQLYTKLLQRLCVSFKEYMANMRLIETEYLQQKKQINVFELDIQKINHDISGLIETQNELRARIGAQTDEQFVVTLQQQFNIKKELDNLNSLLQQYDLALLEQENMEECHQKIAACYEQIEMIQSEQQNHYYQLSQLNYEIEQLEQYGSYEQLKQAVVYKEDETKELIVTYSSFVLAKNLIEKLLSNGQTDYLDQILNKVSELFFIITQKYKTVMYHKDQIAVMDIENNQYFVYELSQGTKEQLYLMFRLSVILMVQDKVNLPIIIDDCFVNFDGDRRFRIYQLLSHIAKTHQILYTTFNEEIRLYEENIISLR